jgi:predicted alpha/beta-hydrolase family hydrolase
VSAAHHVPAQASGDRLVLTHAFGGSLRTPSLVHLADACASLGLETIRFNLPAAEAGRRRPEPPARVEAAWRAVCAQARTDRGRLFIGGRSYGGRIASHVAIEPGACDGLVLLGYPLQPPDRPGQTRDAHLASIEVPILVVQGDDDAFSPGTLLEDAFGPLPNATIHRIADADHAHAVRGRSIAEVAAEVASVIVDWVARTRT